MKNLKYILACIMVTLFFISCDDYLDVEPKGLLIPNSVDDYNLLLNSNEIVSSSDERLIAFVGDDFYDPGPVYQVFKPFSVQKATYTYQNEIYTEEDYINLWSGPYKNIFTYNIIIDEIDEATGNIEEKASIKAEAMVGRAFEYLLLVNAFGKHYDASSSATDLGVPLVLKPDVNTGSLTRASVQEIYNVIIQDLNACVEKLPSSNINGFRATKAAVYGLLTRVYLFQGEFEKALENANMALGEKNYLADYTSIVPAVTPVFQMFSSRKKILPEYEEEQIYHRYFQASAGIGSNFPTPEVLSLFHPDDVRFFVNISDFFGYYAYPFSNSFPLGSNQGISTGEMYLTRAECNARAGNLQLALDDVNLIRSKRILPASYVPIASTIKEEVMQAVFDERRIELLYTGIRLFDLKRLNKESEYAKSVVHNLDGETYVLEPNGNNYVFPIPPQVFSFNPDMVQNQRD